MICEAILTELNIFLISFVSEPFLYIDSFWLHLRRLGSPYVSFLAHIKL